MKQCDDKYITISPNKTWRVVGVVKSVKSAQSGVYCDGSAYLIEDTDTVWIFSMGKPKNSSQYPYIWFEDGKLQMSDPDSDVMRAFNKRNIIDISTAQIAKNTKPDDVLLDEKAVNDMNSAAAIFRPLIEDSDDFLKKMVKTVIIEKEIDISRLKSRMERQYSLPNMKSALQNTTKMSVNYFVQWMELLGCDFALTVADNGSDDINPLQKPITFNSINGNITD